MWSNELLFENGKTLNARFPSFGLIRVKASEKEWLMGENGKGYTFLPLLAFVLLKNGGCNVSSKTEGIAHSIVDFLLF